ncbi:copper resistance CopC family protein [Streptomonospora litoralis]|uniref:CopC domain-containing protein n=1 Tax=Streptomonospora litoralis TaxID=2498135 RepID=A0A4P6Q0W0_9ACTN|nr:copper resistance CopC family protein [Streptomonospora litoralis]QBI52334.1 hypothetical protein EKD16_02590 [Streptomonospora litoralis]
MKHDTSATAPVPTTSAPAARHAPPLRRAAAVAAGLLGSLLLATATAPVALAHDTLLSSSPQDGAELDTAPGEVVLTFSGDIGDGGNAIVVTGPGGEQHQDGEVAIDGPEATVPLQELPTAGEYTVAYRMVSSDGHALEDELAFSITEEAVPEPSPSPSPEEASPVGGAGDAGEASAEESPAAETPADPMSSLGPIGGVIGAIAVIALIAILIIRMRNRPGGGNGEGGGD